MSCEMISSRKIDYYVNDPYARIIDLREESLYANARIRGAIHYEYDALNGALNVIMRGGRAPAKFWQIFSDKSKIYIFYCERGAQSLMICDRMSGMGYNCKSIVGGLFAYRGMNLVACGAKCSENRFMDI